MSSSCLLTCKTDNLSFWKHGLDISTTVLRKDKTTTTAFSISFPTCECNQIRVDRCRVRIEHEFLRNIRNVRSFLVLIFLVFWILLAVRCCDASAADAVWTPRYGRQVGDLMLLNFLLCGRARILICLIMTASLFLLLILNLLLLPSFPRFLTSGIHGVVGVGICG